MISAICRIIVLVFTLGVSATTQARDLAGQWDLKIENKENQEVSTLVIEFTSHKAQSCLGGNWLSVSVVSSATKDANFFPVSDAWSYSVENNQLTIGRNAICDAYLMLKGRVEDETIRGEYFSFGWKSTPLGFFVLSPRRAHSPAVRRIKA